MQCVGSPTGIIFHVICSYSACGLRTLLRGCLVSVVVRKRSCRQQSSEMCGKPEWLVGLWSKFVITCGSEDARLGNSNAVHPGQQRHVYICSVEKCSRHLFLILGVSLHTPKYWLHVSTHVQVWDTALKPWNECGNCEVGGGNENKMYLILFRMKVLTKIAFALFVKSTCLFPWICQVLPNGNIIL
jgi:hypothetical protein